MGVNYNLNFRNVFVPLRLLLVCLRKRHQYKVTFNYWHSVYNILWRRLERWSNFKIQVFIYCYQRGKFQEHLPHNLWGSDVARVFLFYFSKICNMFFTKVQRSYCYTKLCNYREEFVLKPISNIPNIFVCCK